MQRLCRAGLVFAALWSLLAPPSEAQALELEGTWYVLVHYKDDHAGNPDEQRWEDRVWVFAQDGRRLRWTDYPIVVFNDDTGRFERRQSGQYARILHFWRPSDTQLADIRDGLAVNARGSKTKTLRGSDAKGWNSEQRAAAASASVVTYTENWSISGLPDKPVFTRSDVLGGGQTDELEGITRFATTEVRGDGERLVGSFERDGSRRGSFEMMRSAPVGSLEEKTLAQRQRDGLRQAIERDPAGTRALIEDQLSAVGLSVSQEDVDALTATAVGLAAQGVEPEAIRAALNQDLRGMLDKVGSKGARHDDSVRYLWPFDSQTAGRLLIDDRGLVFMLPVGTPVVAAREGVVTRVVDGYREGYSDRSWSTNSVYIRHTDGTVALYAYLKQGAPVKTGQSVKAGERIGSVGGTPGLDPQRLQFVVLRIDPELRSQLVEGIRFVGSNAAGIVAEPGKSYGGR